VADILTKNKNKIWRRQMPNKLKSVLWIRDILVNPDPDPAIFILGLQEFFCLLLFEGTFT
jgi:hypothetical protein